MKDLNTRARIMLATFAPLLLFVFLGLGGVVYAFPRIVRGLVLQRQTALVQIAATGVASEMQGHLRLLRSTADEIGSLVGESETQDAATVQQLLTRRAVLLEIFAGGVGYLDPDGIVLATEPGGESLLGLSFEHRDYFQRVISGQVSVFSSAFRDEPTGRDAVVIAVPVRQRGQVVGVLVGEFDLQRNTWASNLNLLRTSQGSVVYLIDSASTIITHPQANRIGHTVQDDDPELWHLVIGGEPQSRIYQAGRPTSDIEGGVVASYAPIPGIAWGVVLEESWDAIQAQARLSIYAIAGLWGVGIGITALILSYTVRRTLLPLDDVVVGAQSVVEGGTFHPFPDVGASDIRTLVDALNRMVTQLNMQQVALKDYARRVLRSQEDERKRISRDLHDETVQSLVGLNQRLELLGRALDKVDGGTAPVDALVAVQDRLSEVRALAADTLSEVRRMSYNLRPFMLDDLGLAAALRALSESLDNQLPGTHVHCEIVGNERRLPPEIELTAFRIIQEALSNVRKHAVRAGVGGPDEVNSGATRVSVALIYEPWGIVALIEDNGPGVDLLPVDQLVREGHLGIAGMVERAQLFGGTLDVTSAVGEGTIVSLRLKA